MEKPISDVMAVHGRALPLGVVAGPTAKNIYETEGKNVGHPATFSLY
jgi:hypothetical protein